MAFRRQALVLTLLLVLGAAWANFVPDTTGLYERRGETKYSVEYYQQFATKGAREKSLVRDSTFFVAQVDRGGTPLIWVTSNPRSNSTFQNVPVELTFFVSSPSGID
jgi:hypothetical protein